MLFLFSFYKIMIGALGCFFFFFFLSFGGLGLAFGFVFNEG